MNERIKIKITIAQIRALYHLIQVYLNENQLFEQEQFGEIMLKSILSQIMNKIEKKYHDSGIKSFSLEIYEAVVLYFLLKGNLAKVNYVFDQYSQNFRTVVLFELDKKLTNIQK